jgi:hypothetical protein
MWDAFARHRDGLPDPLNRWTMQVVEPIATQFGARALYPFGEPRWPFQRWAQRAEALSPSPLGLLIHPEYGLWHAYRAALVFAEVLDLPAPGEALASPCETCSEKPCCRRARSGAFGMGAYDVPVCATRLAAPEATCLSLGCHARNACPVGPDWRYGGAQVAFHMAAFQASVAPESTATPALL